MKKLTQIQVMKLMLDALHTCNDDDYYFDGDNEVSCVSFDTGLVDKAIKEADRFL